MKSSKAQGPSLRKKRGIAWLDVCVILTMLGIMAGLAWLGWQRSRMTETVKEPPAIRL